MRKFKNVTGSIVPLPRRSTRNAAAYDFFSPEDFDVKPGELKFIWSGVKVEMNPDELFIVNVRSSFGKKKIMIANTQGWIDADYYNNPNNEGNIGIGLYNFGSEVQHFFKNDKIAQGIFVKINLTDDDTNDAPERTGGYGSTGR